MSVREILTLLQNMSKDHSRALRTLTSLEPLHATCINLYKAHADRMLLCRYEDFVAGNTAELEAYLGAKLPAKIEVGGEYRRVARSGVVGAWKHWFTAEDVAFFDGLFADFYATFGYRPEAPHARQRIERADTHRLQHPADQRVAGAAGHAAVRSRAAAADRGGPGGGRRDEAVALPRRPRADVRAAQRSAAMTA